MFNGMKKTLFYLALAVLVAGCAQDIELTEPLIAEGDPQTEYQPLTRSLEGAVYNDVVDAWMVPQADPYTLENFQRAYDNLAVGKSTQKLSKAQAAEFTPAKKLAPTHYALKIYPKNEEEQWRVETMEDVQVAYIPFDWVQLSHDEVEKLPASKTATRSAANTFAEKSPYTVTYDYTETTDGGPRGPVTYQLPILYTVWPVSKPLPDDLEYIVDYPIYQPFNADRKKKMDKSTDVEVSRTLEREAMSLALGLNQSSISLLSASNEYDLDGYLAITGDHLLSTRTFPDLPTGHVPLRNMKVTCRLGSGNWEMTTNASGYFWVQADQQEYWSGSITITYQDPQNRWKITTGSSTAPYSIGLGSFHNIWPDPTLSEDYGERVAHNRARIVVPQGNYQANEIHRAATYYFNSQNDFPKNTLSGGMRIIANSGPDSEHGSKGYFSLPSYEINIFNDDSTDASVIGATLHEIGHYAHCVSNDTRYRYYTQRFLKESLALHVGWYSAHEYYKSQGRTIYPDVDITINGLEDGQGSQMWEKTDPSIYTPLFVDLTDDMNQRAYYGYFDPQNYPNDNIANVPPPVIWNTITSSPSWEQCRAKLESYAGTGSGKYYTVAQFNAWIDAFDEWLETYPENLTTY